jgi:hypothetical protein
MPSFRAKLSVAQIHAVATFVSTAASASSATSASSSTFLNFVPSRQTLSSCGRANFACLRQAFGNLAYYKGPQVALQQLETSSRTSPYIARFCHPIAHAIGHAAYARYHGDAAEALSHGSMTCWSGYYHGVVERAFSGVPRNRVATVARELCATLALSSSSFVRYQCVHGLGHGLMIYSGNDLPYSLRVCDALPTVWDQQSCTGGVFMQNFLPGPMSLAPTKWISAKDLLYPCDAVAPRDKLYCYLMVTSRILPKVHYAWSKAAVWCKLAERDWVRTCFQSLGRDASGFERQRGRPIVAICRIATTMANECIYGAARDITANDAGGQRAAQLCRLAPVGVRAYCFQGIGSILGGFKKLSADRRAACDAVTPKPYRAACYRGAVV